MGLRRSAVVTGAGRGIGLAIAGRLAAAGCAVGILDIDGEAAESAAGRLRLAGFAAEWMQADVTRKESVGVAVDEVAARLGGIDILVNNAGLCRIQHWTRIEAQDFERLFRVNALGVLLASQSALPHLQRSDAGRIVTLVSGAALEPGPTNAHYAASKAAAIALVRSMAADLSRHGITSNGVCPGMVRTDLWKGLDEDFRREVGRGAEDELAARLGGGSGNSPEDVADVVAFLASTAARRVNGQIIFLSTPEGSAE